MFDPAPRGKICKGGQRLSAAVRLALSDCCRWRSPKPLIWLMLRAMHTARTDLLDQAVHQPGESPPRTHYYTHILLLSDARHSAGPNVKGRR